MGAWDSVRSGDPPGPATQLSSRGPALCTVAGRGSKGIMQAQTSLGKSWQLDGEVGKGKVAQYCSQITPRRTGG